MKAFKIVSLIVFLGITMVFYLCWQNFIQYLITDMALLNLEFVSVRLLAVYGLWTGALVLFTYYFWTDVPKINVLFLVAAVFVALVVTAMVMNLISLEKPAGLQVFSPFIVALAAVTLLGRWFEKLRMMARFNKVTKRTIRKAGFIFYVLPSIIVGILFLSFHLYSWQDSFDREVSRTVDEGKNYLEGSGYFSGNGSTKYIKFPDQKSAVDFANKMYKNGEKLKEFYIMETQKYVVIDGKTVEGIDWYYLKWNQTWRHPAYFLDPKLGFFLPEPKLVLFDSIGIY